MTKPFKPMLASPVDMKLLRFPCLASPKLDGVRALAMSGQAMSRSMKNIPNRFIQRWFEDNSKVLEGMDGELIIGDPNADDCYNRTVSGVMREDGEPDFTYYVFDRWDMEGKPYSHRYGWLATSGVDRISLVFSDRIENVVELDDYEAQAIDKGYEGVMLRCPNSPYKQGRSTAKEGYLLKVKRFSDFEATVIGFEERMHNGNEAFTSEIGSTKRSSHQANKIGNGAMGALVCVGRKDFAGVEFNVGTGFDEAMRHAIWANQSDWLGTIIKVKHFAVGGKDKPRHPVFLGRRDLIDL